MTWITTAITEMILTNECEKSGAPSNMPPTLLMSISFMLTSLTEKVVALAIP